MIYFGENNEYILCECEACKGEMYIEKSSIADEDAYAYHLYTPVKCRCGSVDEYINRAKKSCHKIRHELYALSDLLHKQQNVSNKIGEITAELNKKFEPPSFLQSVLKDLLFALKVFFILLGAVIGVEIFLFIITALMFFFGLVTSAPDISKNGNELFYAINIFKERGGNFLSKFGWDANVKPLGDYGFDPSEGLVFGYIPAAIMGIIIIVFYIFLIVLLVRVSINVAKLTFFASKVMNQKIKITQKREEYQKQLDDLSVIYQNLCEQIAESTAIPDDYKNIRAADSILRYFINNRIDTVREALNLYHEEEFRNRLLEYSKAMYGEARQTRRYTKALYIMTSDENMKVDIKDTREDVPNQDNDNAQVGEMLKGAFSKIKKPQTNLKSPKKISRISPPAASTDPDPDMITGKEEKSDQFDAIESNESDNDNINNPENFEVNEFTENEEISDLSNLSDSPDSSDSSDLLGKDDINAIFESVPPAE